MVRVVSVQEITTNYGLGNCIWSGAAVFARRKFLKRVREAYVRSPR